MTQASGFVCKGQISVEHCRNSRSDYEERNEVSSEELNNQLARISIFSIIRVVVNLNLKDGPDHDKLENDVQEWCEQNGPLIAGSVELKEAIEEDEVDLLNEALLAFESGVFIEDPGFFLLCEGVLSLRKSLVFLGLLLDILLSNLNESVFETVHLDVNLHLRHITLNLLDQLAHFLDEGDRHIEQRVLVAGVR